MNTPEASFTFKFKVKEQVAIANLSYEDGVLRFETIEDNAIIHPRHLQSATGRCRCYHVRKTNVIDAHGTLKHSTSMHLYTIRAS